MEWCRNAFNPQPSGILNNLFQFSKLFRSFPRDSVQDGEKEQLWSKWSCAAIYVASGNVYAYGTCHPTRIIKGECLRYVQMRKFNAVLGFMTLISPLPENEYEVEHL